MTIRTRRSVLPLGIVDDVDEPTLLGRHRIDELAATAGRVEHPARPPHSLPEERGDLVPHRLALGLVDVLEPELVQARVVETG